MRSKYSAKLIYQPPLTKSKNQTGAFLKFSYDPRGDFDTDLTWLVVKTNHGKTLRFDPLLTGSGSLIPQLAFRVENGYWAKNADPEDQQLLQNFIDEPEKARELLMSWSPCVIER